MVLAGRPAHRKVACKHQGQHEQARSSPLIRYCRTTFHSYSRHLALTLAGRAFGIVDDTMLTRHAASEVRYGGGGAWLPTENVVAAARTGQHNNVPSRSRYFAQRLGFGRPRPARHDATPADVEKLPAEIESIDARLDKTGRLVQQSEAQLNLIDARMAEQQKQEQSL